MTHLEVVHRVHQLGVDIVARARIRRLGEDDIYKRFIASPMWT